jgi:hypothetical protein
MTDSSNDMEIAAALYDMHLDSKNQCEYNYDDLFLWKSKKGLISILEMDKSHLESAVKMFENGTIKVVEYEKYMQYLVMKNRIFEIKLAELKDFLLGNNHNLEGVK